MATLKDISERVGLDISTVSRALNDSDRVKPETKALVKAVAKELNYKPNDLAQGLAGKKTSAIGIIVPEIKNTFYAEIVDAVEKNLMDEGFSIILGQSKFDSERETYYMDLFERKRVSGIIVVSHIKPLESLGEGVTNRIPVVLIDTYNSNMGLNCVNIDNAYGVKLAIEHLVSLGHNKIGFIGDTVTTEERLESFKSTLTSNKNKVDPEWVIIDDVRFEEGGYKKMKLILSKKEVPTAVFCVNDSMAIGAIKAIKDVGLQVPKHISVVGFDDIRAAAYIETPLTTVRQPKGEMGNIAVSLIMSMISEKYGGFVQNIALKPELIVRETTAKI